jgi:hypothetical protein
MSDPVLTPNFEPVEVAGAVNGTEIVYDLLDRLAEQLLQSDALRETDCYTSYQATLTISLQDVYPLVVVARVEAGTFNPQQPSRAITLNVPVVEADAVRARSGSQPANLERFIDDAGAMVPQAAAPKKKYYVPSGRPRGRPRKVS